jgi:hypothetical protein
MKYTVLLTYCNLLVPGSRIRDMYEGDWYGSQVGEFSG